jgi:NADPH:quinone reductase-like Zn-dependent oxidoreductase
MKAIQYTQYGPPEVCQLVDLPKPIAPPQGVLVKVLYSTVNRTDCGMRTAEYVVSRLFSGLFKPRYASPGCEFAGIIEELGEGHTRFKVGDRVFGYDDFNFGGNAEYKACKANAVLCKTPDNFSDEEAVALTEGAHYALNNIRAAKIHTNSKVMVYGASGAIGSAAVQILKSMKVHVTAVCGTNAVEKIAALQPDVLLDYLQDDYLRFEDHFDFIFDAVGKISFGLASPMLKEDGIYISTELGKNAENVWKAIAHSLRKKGKRILFPIPPMNQEMIEYLASLAATNQLRPLIDKRFPLAQYVEAARYVEAAQKIGNVILIH